MNGDSVSATDTVEPQAVDPVQILRADIERQIRHELAMQQQLMREEAFEHARREGLAAALDQARAEASVQLQHSRAELRQQVEQTLRGLQRAHQLALDTLESSVGEIAFAAVCKLVGQECQAVTFVGALVQRLCMQLRGDIAATLRVHPRDADTLRELLLGPLSVLPLQLDLIPDESLALGGCVAEAASGRYDGTLETQLRRLHAVIGASGTSADEASV
jgi:flagellar assembly protein FliH